jgi:hypothetical protein
MEQSTDLLDVRVVHFGLGPLGAAMARDVANRDGLVSVAAIDISPAREGRDLGEVLGLALTTGVVIDGSSARLRDIEADIVLFAPDSDREAAITDLELLLELGLNVVTIMPELAYPPDDSDDDLAVSIDTLAREAEVTVLALDYSDGLLGTLPLVLTGTCSTVERMTVNLRGIASTNSRLSLADWARGLGIALGWNFDDLDEIEEPEAGVARGHHCIVGSIDGHETLVVDVSAADAGAAPSLHVDIVGTPSLSLTLTGGGDADQAISTLGVNAIPAALTGEPGLFTLVDLPPVHSWTSLGLMHADHDEDDEDED